jgi:methionyl-tRNA formyltransferase
MGTPDFAVASLRALVENGYDVAGVVTQPDKPAGRGYRVQQSAIKQYALAQNLPILQPEKMKDKAFIAALAEWKADVQVVVAFRMLPSEVWQMPRFGTFNLHASLLPAYRGAAPINWAIINGERQTGVTTFFIDSKIDTGKIILQEKIAISDSDNAETIHDALMTIGAKLVCKTIDLIINNSIQSIDQQELADETLLQKTAPKLFRETCKIDWQQSAQQVYNFIRGLSPYPTAWAALNFVPDVDAIEIKIYESDKEIIAHNLPTGTIVSDMKKYAKVAVNDGFIVLKNVQAAGKKRMEIGELLRGLRH